MTTTTDQPPEDQPLDVVCRVATALYGGGLGEQTLQARAAAVAALERLREQGLQVVEVDPGGPDYTGWLVRNRVESWEIPEGTVGEVVGFQVRYGQRRWAVKFEKFWLDTPLPSPDHVELIGLPLA